MAASQDFDINTTLNAQQLPLCCTPATSLDLDVTIKIYDGDPLTGTLRRTEGPYSWAPAVASANLQVNVTALNCSDFTEGGTLTVVWEVLINTITNTGGCAQIGSNYSNGQTITVSESGTGPC